MTYVYHMRHLRWRSAARLRVFQPSPLPLKMTGQRLADFTYNAQRGGNWRFDGQRTIKTGTSCRIKNTPKMKTIY